MPILHTLVNDGCSKSPPVSYVVGGEEKFRDYWPMYLKKARVLVFVLDSSNSTRFPLAKTSLHRLLAAELYLPLVLLANKQVNTTRSTRAIVWLVYYGAWKLTKVFAYVFHIRL